MGSPSVGRSVHDWRGKWDRLVAESRRKVDPETLVFPTDAQTDLLKAALFRDERAAAAWRRWKARGLELQTVADIASMQLFPLLWTNRDVAHMGAEDLRILKGIQRHTIAYNAAILGSALKAVRLLEEAGIPVVFLKGAAVVALTGGHLGWRRIADADVLVREADADRAISALVAAGYVASPDTRPTGFSHGRGYRAFAGPAIDLHWYAYKTAGDDSAVFASAREENLLNARVLVPAPTECLIVAIAHAFQESLGAAAPLRWIADAMLITENADIDWDYLLDRAKRPGLTLALADGLGFLASEFGAPVPALVLRELRRRPVSWRERWAHRAAVNRPVVGSFVSEQLSRHRARRLHPWTGLPRDFLWHMAQASGGVRRRDVVRRAPRTAVWTTALLAVRTANASVERLGAKLSPPSTELH